MLEFENKKKELTFRLRDRWSMEMLQDRVAKDLGSYPLRNYRSVLIILRELLNNAYWHGNGGVDGRYIRGRINWASSDEVVVEVEDEGEGFDFQTIDPRVDEKISMQTRRGYKVIYSLARQVSFNEKGNKVQVKLGLKQDEA
ncbi:MAG TPA: hypothetical protein ENN41_09370 [Sediminispirochaeta sp.]|nr:hypothetical protein [Sediminispirochaeta sp.]